jgi:C4-dicarboxylate-specific signal transduction histidine kinase
VSERQRRQWLRLLRAELERRIGGQTIDHRQRNDRLIDEVAARLRAAPDWREPSEEERREALKFFGLSG